MRLLQELIKVRVYTYYIYAIHGIYRWDLYNALWEVPRVFSMAPIFGVYKNKEYLYPTPDPSFVLVH